MIVSIYRAAKIPLCIFRIPFRSANAAPAAGSKKAPAKKPRGSAWVNTIDLEEFLGLIEDCRLLSEQGARTVAEGDDQPKLQDTTISAAAPKPKDDVVVNEYVGSSLFPLRKGSAVLNQHLYRI